MNYLLDTCVLSKLVKKQPEQRVVQWISSVEESRLFISVLTIGELLKGIERLPESAKRETLQQWVAEDLQERFNGKMLAFNLQAAVVWGMMQAKAEAAGRAMPVMDSMIAATGAAHDLAVVTLGIFRIWKPAGLCWFIRRVPKAGAGAAICAAGGC